MNKKTDDKKKKTHNMKAQKEIMGSFWKFSDELDEVGAHLLKANRHLNDALSVANKEKMLNKKQCKVIFSSFHNRANPIVSYTVAFKDMIMKEAVAKTKTKGAKK